MMENEKKRKNEYGKGKKMNELSRKWMTVESEKWMKDESERNTQTNKIKYYRKKTRGKNE